ncbi:MAG: TetR family transcriptional regulator [Acidobacteria bacterium]|nr:MAG: TetR family transcriptional regulator [Acidobacteriota bacterium]PIE91085.1 MAG: TetR family transcriptional regulator [Acidobacteriota bacterium]
MSIRDTSLDPRIMESAKKEFVKKGFLDASLNTICRNAGITTGAIYRRFKGKEELFIAVVQPAIDVLNTLSDETFEAYKTMEKEHSLKETWANSTENIKKWIKRLYKEKESIKILLSKSDGTVHSNFIHNFIEENFRGSYQLMKDFESKGVCRVSLSYEEYHILVTCYWTALFEMFVHDFTLENALAFALKTDKFFAWKKFIEF